MDELRPAEPPPAPARPLERAESWLATRRRGVLLLLVLAAALFRVVYFVQLTSGPCSAWHEWDQSDLHFFHQWGRSIADGDWLSRDAGHPHHGWHGQVARRHFQNHPEDEGARKARGEDPERSLWNDWYGGRLFHQEPLYAYLVGVTYASFGPDPRWVYAWQMILGIGSILLVWWIARRHFGELAAAAAGLLAVLCGPLLFYELVLLRTSLTVFAGLGLVALFDLAEEKGTSRQWALAGAGAGTALLLQSTFALFLIFAMAWLAWKLRRRALKPAAITCGVALLCLVPAAARNLAVGASPLGLSAVGPVTFIASNTPEYDPANAFMPDDAAIARHMDAGRGKFGPVVLSVLKEHSIGSVFKLVGGKFAELVRNHEMPNNKSFLFYRRHAPILGATFVSFLVILALSVVGLVAALKTASTHAFLLSIVGGLAAPMMIFYVLSRFRAPLAMALVPFAAIGAVTLVRWALDRRWAPVGISCGVMIALGIWSCRPIRAYFEPIRYSDYRVAFDTFWKPQVNSAIKRSSWLEGAGILEEALRDEPEEVRRLDGTRIPPERRELRVIASWFELLHTYRGELLGRAGRTDEARRETDRGAVLKKSRE
jgi:4-amino-4-deoxy-L-arabinose transferase-like glycosyltransferase